MSGLMFEEGVVPYGQADAGFLPETGPLHASVCLQPGGQASFQTGHTDSAAFICSLGLGLIVVCVCVKPSQL